MDRIDALAAEYHEAGKHLKNMGRALFDKEALQEAKDSGTVAKIVKTPYRASRACMEAVKKAAEKSVNALGRLEKSAQRPSVLKAMRDQAAKKDSMPSAETSEKKAVRPER